MGLDPLCVIFSCTFFRGKGLRAALNTRTPGIPSGQMFWLIWPPVLCLHILFCMCALSKTPPLHMHTRLWAHVLHGTGWKNRNWRQSVCRLWGLEEGSSSESWLSSQEVLFLTALHKHWKRDAKKGPRLTISTVNTYCSALCSVPLGQHVYFICAPVSEWILDSGNSFTSSNYEYSILFLFFSILKCFISTAVIKSRAIKQDLLVGKTPGVNVPGSCERITFRSSANSLFLR